LDPQKTPLIYRLKSFLAGFLFFAFSFQGIRAQDSLSIVNPPKMDVAKRVKIVGMASASLYVGSMAVLYSAWYKGFATEKFHAFNDTHEWLQMDKAGHVFSAYHISRYASDLLSWTGLDRNVNAWTATAASILCMTSIEVFDGFSHGWGFSSGDVLANISGAGLFLGQELAWHEQRIRMKYSFLPSTYAVYRSNLLGHSLAEQMLKDYNAQTYWLSINLSSFASSNTKIPSWLSLAFGYGAEGMIGGNANPIRDAAGNPYPQFQRNRQFFFSPEIELSRIKTKKRWLKSVLNSVSMIKIPLPTLELKSNGKWVMHPIYF